MESSEKSKSLDLRLVISTGTVANLKKDTLAPQYSLIANLSDLLQKLSMILELQDYMTRKAEQ
jgi:hypothetical protein